MTLMQIVQVVVPLPLYNSFDYLVPSTSVIDELKPGCRVRIQFGNRTIIGMIWTLENKSHISKEKLKLIYQIIDEKPILNKAHLTFLNWCADYYQAPIGEVVFSALPVLLRKGRQLSSPHKLGWSLGASANLNLLQRAPVQRQIFEKLQQSGKPLTDKELQLEDPSRRSAIKRMEQKGLVQRAVIETQSLRPQPTQEIKTLTDEQQAIVKTLSKTKGFDCFLIDGITGSGKTEVYLQFARQILAKGKQVIVLVPEISLTPQLLERFRASLSARIAVMHSGLNPTEREKAWNAMREHKADLALGTRSMIFTPVKNLGLIIVDEEHDSSYKQPDNFCYSARDLAVYRGKLAQVPVILGSATPALESLHNAMTGRYQWLKLRKRPGNARLPQMQLIDIRSQHTHQGLSAALLKAIREEISDNNQVLLFLNRRGYAPQYRCSKCGWYAKCSHCDARMTWHQQAKQLRCHHCGALQHQPQICPDCQSKETLVPLGQGTQRIEEVLQHEFSKVPLFRIDRDTTRRKDSMQGYIEQLKQEKNGAILIGTQMLAKGHDFPNVTLVGVINTDASLMSPELRAAEKTAQLVLQVAGRAGRADKPGRVLIQTAFPDHPLLNRLLQKGYAAFASQELKVRQTAGFPPYSYQALLQARSRKQENVKQFVKEIALRAQHSFNGIEVWGPFPAIMERKAGVYRWCVLFQSKNRALLQQQLDTWLQDLRDDINLPAVHWSIDIDPIDT